MWGLGFRVLGFRVWGLGCRVLSLCSVAVGLGTGGSTEGALTDYSESA